MERYQVIETVVGAILTAEGIPLKKFFCHRQPAYIRQVAAVLLNKYRRNFHVNTLTKSLAGGVHSHLRRGAISKHDSRMITDPSYKRLYNSAVKIIENGHAYITCSICNATMLSGYLVKETTYYCSDACLSEHYTDREFLDMYKNGTADWYQF